MNYLAHMLLADGDDEAMLGAFLGDFVKGRQLEGFCPVVAREIIVHRRVDTFTDTHPVVADALAQFEAPRRRFAGIALDVFYDHVLARDFSKHAGMPLDQFTQRVYRLLGQRQNLLPPRARHVAEHMIAHDWLSSYARFDDVGLALRGIGRRLSRGGEQLEACAQDLADHCDQFAAGFPALMADLRCIARNERARLQQAGLPPE